MWFGILGPLEARDGEREIDLGRPKQQAVLAALLLEANRVVAIDRLIDLLWGDEPPASATGALQVYISGLRRALEPERAARTWGQFLITNRGGYSLRIRPEELDAARFEELFNQGHRLLEEGRIAVARRLLGEGLALWRGPVLGELAHERFAYAEATRLEELRVAALEDRIAADLALGRHTTAIAELEALVLERPFRERLWALLALALYRSERQTDALRTFTRARTVLGDELGLEPGPSLRQLEQEILEQAESLAWRPPRDEPAEVSVTHQVGGGHLVGRAQELRTLDGLLADAESRRGGLVLISGEPGIGKTRLVQEMVARAVARGGLVAWGRCHEGEGAPSFWPWVQVIKDLLRGGDRETLRRALLRGAAEIAQISPEVKEIVPEFDPPTVLDPAAARFRLYEAVADMVGAVASDRPLVVVLDDLHWADVPSLKLAEFVAAHTAETGAVLVATFRDVDPAVGGPLADTLGVLARHPSLHRIGLAGLSEEECTEYIAGSFGVTPSSAVASTIHSRTDGNPFFVAELARLLAGDGGLEDEQGPVERVPVGVRDVIRRRLHHLPDTTNDLLAQAAVLGRDVDLRTLAVAARTEPDVVAGQLAESVDRAILVTHTTPGRYVFSHALTQETILGELNLSRRAKLHARAAAALRVVHGNDDAVAVELAHHLYEATPVVGLDDAHAAALRAAEVSQRRLAYEQAEHQLRRALELTARMAPGPDRWHRELDVQHRLAALLSVTQGYHSAGVAAAWERAAELCQELGDTPEVLTSLVGLARLTRTRGQYAMCIELGEQLQRLADETLSSAFAVAAHEARGHAKLFVGAPAESAAHLEEVLRLADLPSLDDPTVVLYPGVAAKAYLACARWLLGDEDGAAELIAGACDAALVTRHPLTIAIAQLYAGKLASMRGDPRETLRWAVKVESLARSGTIGPLEPVRVILVSWARTRLGDFSAGEAGFVRPLAQLRSSGWRLAFSYFLALKADAHRAAGHLDQALDAVRQGLVEAEATGEHYYEPELYRLAGELTVARWPDRTDDAEGWLRRAVDAAQAQGAVAWERRAQASLARLSGPPAR
jgi:DNA-binding SARP family transcriptional activator